MQNSNCMPSQSSFKVDCLCLKQSCFVFSRGISLCYFLFLVLKMQSGSAVTIGNKLQNGAWPCIWSVWVPIKGFHLIATWIQIRFDCMWQTNSKSDGLNRVKVDLFSPSFWGSLEMVRLRLICVLVSDTLPPHGLPSWSPEVQDAGSHLLYSLISCGNTFQRKHTLLLLVYHWPKWRYWLYLAAREAGKCWGKEIAVFCFQTPCSVLILGESIIKNEGEKIWVGLVSN